MPLEEVHEARRLRQQARELMRRAQVERGRLGEVVAKLIETRRAVQRVRLQARREAPTADRHETTATADGTAQAGASLPWHSQREWLNRFTVHLCGLRADLASEAAMEAALDAWPSFWLVTPESAARSMAAICRSVGRPAP